MLKINFFLFLFLVCFNASRLNFQRENEIKDYIRTSFEEEFFSGPITFKETNYHLSFYPTMKDEKSIPTLQEDAVLIHLSAFDDSPFPRFLFNFNFTKKSKKSNESHQSSSYHAIVTSFQQGEYKNLYFALKNEKFALKMVQKTFQRKFFWKLANQIHYLHRKGVIHRDISMVNILIDKEYMPVLFGFETSAFDLNGDGLFRGKIGSEYFMAPEVKNYPAWQELYSYSSDWYRFGVLMKASFFIALKTCEGNLKERLPFFHGSIQFGDFDAEFRDLIVELTREDPNERTEYAKLCQKAYFKDFVQDELEILHENDIQPQEVKAKTIFIEANNEKFKYQTSFAFENVQSIFILTIVFFSLLGFVFSVRYHQ